MNDAQLDRVQADATRVLSLVLAFSIAARLLMGWLADRFAKKYVMVLIYLLVAAAIPLLFAGRSHTAVHLFALVLGIGLGGDYLIVPLVTAEIFGMRRLGLLLGLILTSNGVAERLRGWLATSETRLEVIPLALSPWPAWGCWASRRQRRFRKARD